MIEPVILDQSTWGQIRVTGSDRARFLGGMLTSNAAALAPGAWCRAAMLSVKGRVLALADAVNEGESYVLITEATTADKLVALLDKHAIADDVAFTREQRPLHRVWGSTEAVWTAPPVWAAPPGGASPEADVEVRRVEAGLPRYGVDVGEDYFPFEANLERAISFDKGCYVGQEVVVRATTRGGAKKKLVGLRLDGGAQAVAAVAAGAAVVDETAAEVGKVTSVVLSPRHGAIALAYVSHTRWTPGTAVLVAGRPSVVSALPFGD